MPFSDLTLARRLERAEGHACVQYAVARRRLFPDSGAEWMECAGTYAVFDGIASPVTQTFGLGIFEELSPSSLDVIERVFLDRKAQVDHEVSPISRSRSSEPPLCPQISAHRNQQRAIPPGGTTCGDK